MKVIHIVTKDNLGQTIQLGKLVSGYLDVNIDNETIVVNANGELSVNPLGNYLKYSSIGEQQSWIIEHNFGYEPLIQVYNMDNKLVWVSPMHTDSNTIQITFDKPRAGYALLTI